MNDLAAIKVDKYLYWPHQLVGQGSFATVYRGKRITDNLPMAVKKIKINEMGNRINKLWSEIKIMKQLSHINILKLYDVHLDMESEVVYLFLEWCQDGDLSQVIKLLNNSKSRNMSDARKWDSGESKSRNMSDSKSLSESQIRTYFKQIRAGLEYLHQQNILHRDLKPQNILLNNGQVKICDFGLSILADQNSLITTMCGSPMYMAPEVIRHQDYTTKADLWSLGVILYELIYSRHPYPVTTYPDLITAIDKPIKYPLDRVISDSGTLLLKGLLEPVVESRLDWSDFFNHAWFQIDLDNTLRRRTGGEYKLEASISPEPLNDAADPELFYSFDDDLNEMNDRNEMNERNEINDESRTNLSGAIAIRNPSKNFDLSQYIVKDYSSSQSSNSGDITGQSAPVTSTAFGQSYSPRLSFNSVGSQVYKCLSKSYNVLKKNL